MFLVEHSFVAATWRVPTHASLLLLHVYLIPIDLPNIGGILLCRDSALCTKAAELLRSILTQTRIDPQSWEGHTLNSASSARYFIQDEQDDRTLGDLFSQVESPTDIYDTTEMAFNGLRTKLYRYQINTVAKMLQLESRNEHNGYMCRRTIDDPTYVAVTNVYSERNFFLQPTTMCLRLELPKYAPRPGGILCEAMGLGKTVILLAVILTTRGKLPLPKITVDSVNSEPLTPVGLRRLPVVRHQLSNFALSVMKEPTDVFPQLQQPPPSLTNLSLHAVRLNNNGMPTNSELDILGDSLLKAALLLNTPFYLSAKPLLLTNESRRSSRKKRDHSNGATSFPQKIYLSSATLVVVPHTLFKQWASEIEKHCEQDALRCYMGSNRKHGLPSAAELASLYDVVLLTHDRFTAELPSARNRDKLASWSECNCPAISTAYDVPNCKCGATVSSLVQIHWRRVAIDEGHSLSASRSQLVELADMLIEDAMWIVTGTPTTNLVGFHLAQSLPESDFYKDPADSEQPGGSIQETSQFIVSLKEERADLMKLESLVVSFLHLPQVTNNIGSNYFRQHIAAPFLHRRIDQDGHLFRSFGSVRVVEQMMSQCMVRHRMRDIEMEVRLPPLTKEVVLLDLHPLAVITYNVILALVAGNAVDSDRTDQDWLFHSANRGSLLTVMQNLSQSLFWHADAEALNQEMRQHVRRAKKTLQKAIHLSKASTDINLARAGLDNLEYAASHLVWMPLMARPQTFVPFTVFNLPDPLHEAWAVPQAEGPLTPLGERSTLMHPDRLLSLRKWIQSQPFKSRDVPSIAQHGHALNDLETEHLRFAQEVEGLRKGSQKRKRHKEQQQVQHKKALETLQPSNSPFADISRTIQSNELCSPTLLRGHPLSEVRIGQSASAKLNYVLREVLNHVDHKFLIFSGSPLSLAHLGEALSVARVSHLKIMTEVARERWSQHASMFQSSDSVRCLLMEIRYGARGLNLTAADRIIFLEPVWRADEESQALKRAHRIGQINRILVTTLAIRDTVEEEMVSRRQQLQGMAGTTPRAMLDEPHMRSYVQNPVFLAWKDQEHEETAEWTIPLLPQPGVDEASEAGDGEDETSSPAKRARVVRFAD
ncbi:SNF2 family N-terminal domain-containing protein [Auriculariales sp. MPI-PUGE-AT-0066]|nr:SNF2 family N-terminal domain-containing protein [Auriculariales sp. MPI-PUGE-AT-0066]